MSRWHGGGFINGSPKALKTFLWSVPFAAAGVWASGWVMGLVALALCMAGKATGHGGGMDLAHSPKEPGAAREPEKLEYLILWAHPYIPRYLYDAILLALVGFAAVSGGAVAVGWTDPLAGLLIAAGGLLKPVAYMVGWAVYPKGQGKGPPDLNEATEIGEFITGVFAYGGLGCAYLLMTS